MNREQVARELLKLAKDLTAKDMSDDFIDEISSGRWSHYAIFPGKKKPGKNPKNMGELKRSMSRSDIDRVVATPISLKKDDKMLGKRGLGTIRKLRYSLSGMQNDWFVAEQNWTPED